MTKQSVWRLVMSIRQWTNSLTYPAHEQRIGRRRMDPDWIAGVAARIDFAGELIQQRLNAVSAAFTSDAPGQGFNEEKRSATR